jgi:subtilisin family serine protease
MRRTLFLAVPAAAALAVAALAGATPLRADGIPETYVVLYDADASPESARRALRAAGGRLLRENLQVGVATAVTSNPDFVADVAGEQALAGAARNAPIGHARPLLRPKLSPEDLGTLREATKSALPAGAGPRRDDEQGEPLAHLQWGMRLIHATPDGSYDEQRGDRRVLVGILDTGVDGRHPDIAPNFDRKRSRNFTTDIPLVDGPCEEEPDASCSDAADVDENSHGTHVASIVASPINRLGVAGVAPEVTIVNLRAGQDSGFFFLQATLDALTYAGDNGIDVVNMSYFIDPWLYNCAANPADTPEQQLEQQTIIAATQRALDYAHARGVTLIAAAGNGDTDLGDPSKFDDQSPNFPPGTEHDRTVDNTCLDLPTEGNNVLSISSIGPTKRKADYSNYGVEQITVAAPGGFFRDDPWSLSMTPDERTAAGIPNLILAAYPENVAREFGEIEPDGTPNTPFVLRDCRRGTCAYYQYLQGTSMASPHAAGVAALIVSEHGRTRRGDKMLDPATTQRILEQTATEQPCPEPRLHSYADKGRPPSFDALCEGTPELNGFYGHGIVDALRAVEDDEDDDDR